MTALSFSFFKYKIQIMKTSHFPQCRDLYVKYYIHASYLLLTLLNFHISCQKKIWFQGAGLNFWCFFLLGGFLALKSSHSLSLLKTALHLLLCFVVCFILNVLEHLCSIQERNVGLLQNTVYNRYSFLQAHLFFLVYCYFHGRTFQETWHVWCQTPALF